MHAKSVFRLIAVLLVAGLVSACSSAGRTMLTTSSVEPIPPGKTASLVVEPTAGNRTPAYLDAARRIREQLSKRLIDDRVFGSLVDTSEVADYVLDIKVREVSETSPAARVFLTVFVPRSSVQVGVDLRARDQEKPVKSFQTTGYGAKNWMSAQGYGIDDPVREVVNQVVFTLK